MCNYKNNPDKKCRCPRWCSWLFIGMMVASACLLLYIAFAKKGNLSCVACSGTAIISLSADSTAAAENPDSLTLNIE